jgi:phosphatidylglycerol:prolipoprotein diacylglycerol transferase
MYPVLFRIGQFEITSFGVLVALATVVAWRVLVHELRVSGLPDKASDVAVYAIAAGFVGAKLLWVF